jgi:hypothetical protein
MSSQACLPWLLDLYPGEQVFQLDRLQQGGMVGGHVRWDCRNDGLVAVAPGHVTAFARGLSWPSRPPRTFYASAIARMLA